MKQLLASAALAGFLALPQLAAAQFNNRYAYSSAGAVEDTRALDLLPHKNVEMTVLIGMDSLYGPTGRPSNHILLRKTDRFGIPLFVAEHFNADSSYGIQPWRMAPTSDHGYIVTGQAQDASGIAQPFAAKFDAGGNYQWSYVYQSNRRLFADSVRTAIVPVQGDSIESYFLVRAGANDSFTKSGQQLVVTNVTKIDGSGQLLWNKKYYSPLTGGDSVLRDYPTAACWVSKSASGGNYCFIGGAQYGRETVRRRTGKHFFLGVDAAGNMVRPFTLVEAPGLPYNHDAVFDPAGGRYPIALTWSLGNSRLDSAKVAGANTLLGFMRLDDDLGPLFQLYYRSDSASQNEGVRISLSGDSSAYLIGANTALPSLGTSLSLFRISKLGAPLWYGRYNAGTDSKLWALCQLSDGQSTSYAAGGSSAVPMGSNDYNTRLILTNGSGSSCGYEELKVYRADYPNYPVVADYQVLNVRGAVQIELTSPGVDEQQGSCDSADPGHSKPGR